MILDITQLVVAQPEMCFSDLAVLPGDPGRSIGFNMFQWKKQ